MTGRQIAVPGPPVRIKLQRKKGWRLPNGARSVARPTRWGNPFRIGDPIPQRPWGNIIIQGQSLYRDGTVRDAAHAVDLFTMWLYVSVPFTNEDVTAELGGRDLACWCPVGTPCHGDVLLRLANHREGTS